MVYRKCDFCPNTHRDGVPILKLTTEMKRTWELNEARTYFLCLSEAHFKLEASNYVKEREGINGRKRWKPNTVLPVEILDSLQQLDSAESSSSSSEEEDYSREILADDIGNGFEPTESSQSVKDAFSDDDLEENGENNSASDACDDLYETESEVTSDTQSLSQSQSQSEVTLKGKVSFQQPNFHLINYR